MHKNAEYYCKLQDDAKLSFIKEKTKNFDKTVILFCDHDINNGQQEIKILFSCVFKAGNYVKKYSFC